MIKLHPTQWLLAALAGELGFDKDTWKTRVNEGLKWYKSHSHEERLLEAKKETNTVFYSYVIALEAIEAGELVHTPVRLDWGSSGISILSCVFRDAVGLENTSSIRVEKPLGVYGLLMEKMGLDPKDSEKKKIVKKKMTVPYVYGGDSGVKHNLHKVVSFTGTDDPLVAFGQVYGSLFPSAKEARKAFLDAWDEDIWLYSWFAPDGFQCRKIVAKSVDSTVELYSGEGGSVGKMSVHLSLSKIVTKQKGEAGTRGLGANVVQSTDAYILREIIRRGRASKLRENFKKFVKSGEGKEPNETISSLINTYEEQKVPTLVILEYLEEPTKLPQDVVEMLEEELNTLTDDYEVLPVHDEFGVLPTKVQALRINANRVFAGIYKSNLGAYWNKVFNMNITINHYDEEVYEDILDSDYLIN